MARTKQATPVRRNPSSEQIPRSEKPGPTKRVTTLHDSSDEKPEPDEKLLVIHSDHFDHKPKEAGLTELLFCIGGIYASFLTWALLQERITTTSYGPPDSPVRFRHPIFLNTLQSLLASLTGYLYLWSTTPRSALPPTIFSRPRALLPPLLLISLTSSLASPFGYAALAHIDYLTFILAKSCKLLPVMALHLTVFRKRYALSKYLVVLLVTLGVATFTLYHPSSASSNKKGASTTDKKSSAWGLFLLAINLLLDGLTNATQDHIFSTLQPFTGPQMMAAQNILTTLLTTSYLVLSPLLSPLFSLSTPLSAPNELTAASSLLLTHPPLALDVFLFALCGAVGQLFIFTTLARFSSLLLVTVTVTRKMLTMLLSVVWFGHRLSGMQWVGVGMVFGGVGAEGWIQRREKKGKEESKKRKEEGKEL
ncbi:MAG: UDP-galactose transporter [Vezdaea acicularis]|nr:MAG: UDP-galactose transporter [Vezdaea acicularis]